MELNDPQAVIEILPEHALLHLLVQVQVGGRDDPHVGALGLHAAHGEIGLLLDQLEKFPLEIQGQGADLI